MKKTILPAVIMALGVGVSTASLADNNDAKAINLGGQVAKTCHIAATPTASSGGSGTFTTTLGANSSTINISDFVDSGTAVLKTGINSITLSYPSVYCNFAHTLSVKATNSGMENNAPIVAGSENLFTNVIHYSLTARLNNNTGSASVLTNGVPNLSDSDTINHAHNGSMDVEIQINSNGPNAGATTVPLLAGTFSDTAVVSLTAQP